MKQIVLEEPGRFSLRDGVAEPKAPGSGEALVKILRVGICGTDLHAFRGVQPFFEYPRVLGHELAVEVMELGAGVSGLQTGALCTVEPYLSCGRCIACAAGKTNCCVEMQVLGVHVDGGMCNYFILPADKLISSEKLSSDQLALVEMLGIGAQAVSRGSVQNGEYALVIGAGPIGMGTMQFAKAAGAKVIAMDMNEQRLAFCKDELGVAHTLTVGGDAAQSLEQLCGGALPTVIFDATGAKASMEKTFDLVSHGGRIVFVGHTKGEISFQNPTFHKKELTLLASRNTTNATMRELMQQIEEGSVNTDPWITHRASMESLAEEFPSWLEPETGVIKAMLEI